MCSKWLPLSMRGRSGISLTRQEYLIDRYPVAVTPGLQILGAKQSVGNHSGILIGGLTAKSALVQNNKRGDILVSKFL